MNYNDGQPRPLAYVVIRNLACDEPGNFSYKEIAAGTLLYRYTGHTYNTAPLPTGVMVSTTGPLDTPFFEVPLSALKVYEYLPGKTEVLPVLNGGVED